MGDISDEREQGIRVISSVTFSTRGHFTRFATMKTYFLILAVITLQFSAVLTEISAPEEKTLNEEIVSSADSKNDTTTTTTVEDELREAVHGDEDPPKVAVDQENYAEGTPLPETTDDPLDATDDESILNILDIQQGGKPEQDEAESTKKDLSSYGLPPPFDPQDPHGQGWFQHRMWHKENHVKPLVLKEPTLSSILQLPLWVKLRRDFARSLKLAARRN